MNYIGSKNKIAHKLLPIMLSVREGRSWVEPFVGGANMIDKVYTGIRIGNDNHYYLIELLKAIQSGWIPPENITKDFYYEVKSNKEKYEPHLVGFVGFGCSFGRSWFDGYAKDKRGDNYAKQAKNNLLQQARNLQGIQFVCGDYRDLEIPKNSLIYCDPPYIGTYKYSSSKSFDHDEFWEWCRNKIKEGHKVFVSEYIAPEDFVCIRTISKLTTLNKDSNDTKSIERLFVHESVQNKT